MCFLLYIVLSCWWKASSHFVLYQVTNYTLKSAASVSNALGSVVVSYSICHALLSLAGSFSPPPHLVTFVSLPCSPPHSILNSESHYSLFHIHPTLLTCISGSDENERLPEEAKSCISGTLTGLLFKSTSGAVKCLKVWLLKPNFNSFSFQFHAICSWNNISSRAEQLGSGLLPFGPLVWKSKNRCNITSRPPPLPSSSSLAMSTSSNHNHVCGGHDHDIRHGQDHSMSSATSTNLDSFSCDVI